MPLVGSIPLIGHLFKENTVNVQSQELLFFLTPRILPGLVGVAAAVCRNPREETKVSSLFLA